MKRWSGAALFLAAAVLFLIANRGAYEGFFQDDELDNISWTPAVSAGVYVRELVSPRLAESNFRPVGHLFFNAATRAFGLDFPKYIFPLHALHLLNVWLLWRLARRLGCNRWAASAGAILFSFHMACFDIYWKPMYVFDLLCGTFVLSSLLLWTGERWVLSFAAFWLAYKSKELAVMLPFVLLGYEYWLGKRRWKPLLPFLLASFTFGVQALIANRGRSDVYAFRFQGGGLRETARYYSDRILMIPFGGVALPFVPLVVRDRRVWFGIVALFLFFAPLTFLPGRVFAAYCYVPLIGAALALAAIADHGHRVFVAIFFLVWIPFNMIHLRMNRRQALAIADENRRYVAGIREFASQHPGMRRFVFDGRPFALHSWGVKGALAYFYRTNQIDVVAADDAEAQKLLHSGEPVAVLTWDPLRSRVLAAARRQDTPLEPFIKMGPLAPIWQLGQGWFSSEGSYRWTRPVARATLQRPEGARRFELTVNVNPDLIRDLGRSRVRVWLNETPLGERVFTRNGWQTAEWELAPAPAGPVPVRLEADPYRTPRDNREFGVAVVSFGFKPRE
ncbi:MAG: hypothetical protein ACE15B_11990 [Bryobacteraceae bacterium]